MGFCAFICKCMFEPSRIIALRVVETVVRAPALGTRQGAVYGCLGTVEEEADESAFWMELVIESGMKPAKLVSPLLDEAQQLVRIAVASIRTGRRSGSPIRSPQSKIQNR